MKTNVKKAVAVFSTATILMGVPCVHAEGGDISVNSAGTGVIMPRFVGITSYDSELKLNSSNVLCCYAQTTVRTPYVASVKVELKENGSTVKTWSAKEKLGATVDETYKPTKGSSYILRVTYATYDSSDNLIESVVGYSNEVIYN